MQTKTKAIILIVIILTATAGFGIYLFQKNRLAEVKENPAAQTKPPEPEKTDFGASVPTDFPTDIPLEEGAEVQQSYGLNYVGQKQLTIVFLSSKTIKENYSLYADFLKKQNWNILNTYESAELSSLYGVKENNTINVTISDNTSNASIKSQVSISVLKK